MYLLFVIEGSKSMNLRKASKSLGSDILSLYNLRNFSSCKILVKIVAKFIFLP